MSLSKKNRTHASDRVYALYILGAMAILTLVAVGAFLVCAAYAQGTPMYLFAAVVGSLCVGAFVLGALFLGMVLPSKIAAAIKARSSRSESNG